MKNTLVSAICTTLFFTVVQFANAETTTLVYARNLRMDYAIELLNEAIHISNLPYRLEPSTIDYEQKRSLKTLSDGKDLDISWSMTSVQRESVLLPIRIPIYKGLIGWRIPMINTKHIALFESISSIEQLRGLAAGQVHDWPDVLILEHNGFNVWRAGKYEGLFKMLAFERIDYFPRSVIEIWWELEDHKNMNLVADKNIVIHYPTAFYYFLNRNDREIAEELEASLEKLISTGRFDEIFMHHNGEYIRKAQLKKRRLFKVDNPILPKETPLGRKELWFSLDNLEPGLGQPAPDQPVINSLYK